MTGVANAINSPKKMKQFELLVYGSAKKLVKAVKTRWLTNQAANERLLLLWNSVLRFLEGNDENDLITTISISPIGNDDVKVVKNEQIADSSTKNQGPKATQEFQAKIQT